ncbi:MAG: FkbM family methyltransferase [Opitutales bacterium]
MPVSSHLIRLTSGLRSLVLRVVSGTPRPIKAFVYHHASLLRLASPLLKRVSPVDGVATVRFVAGPNRGLWLVVDRSVPNYFWLRADYESVVHETLDASLRPGCVACDVGAHMGFGTLHMARLVGPTGHIHAFEPDPANHRKLRRNCELNHLHQVTCHSSVVSDRNTTIKFCAGGTTTSQIAQPADPDALPLPTVTLDNVFRQSPRQRLDLVKVDAEGAELKVLKGAAHILATLRPIWVIEIHSAQNLADCGRLLIDAGYQLEALTASDYYARALAGIARHDKLPDGGFDTGHIKAVPLGPRPSAYGQACFPGHAGGPAGRLYCALQTEPNRHLRLQTILTLGLLRIPACRRATRQTAAALFRLLLRVRSRPYDGGRPGVTVIVSPHPDDEALGCTGLIAARRQTGQPVHLVYLTDGGASHTGHPTLTRTDLVAWRAREARQAMAILGVEPDSMHFLDVPDGCLAGLGTDEAQALVNRLRSLLAALAPVELFTPCRRDGSTEHEAGFQLLRTALAGLEPSPRLLEYPVWSWWNSLRLLHPLWRCRQVLRVTVPAAQKAQVLACYRSQLEPVAPWENPVMPRDFVALFRGSEEYFFAWR